jgi:Protein of unknown function (DUF2953).
VVSVLGLLLTVLILLLFVPVRYHVNLRKEEEISGRVTAGWLFCILFLKLYYQEQKLIYQVKVFGFTIKSNLPQKQKKPQKKKIKKNRKKVNKTKSEDESKKSHGKKNNKESYNKEIPDNLRKDSAVGISDGSDDNPERKLLSDSQAGRGGNHNSVAETKDLDNQTDLSRYISSDYGHKTSTNKKQKNQKKKHKNIIMQKLRGFMKKMKLFWQKVRYFFQGIKKKIRSIIESIKNLLRKKELLVAFWENERNKKGIKLIFQSFKKVLRHILPTKIKGNITFGTGDPCSTGQALGAFSILYARYGNGIQVNPDFENAVLTGHVDIKGRIRLFTLLIICIKLILDKNFKQLRKNYTRLKEEL